MKNQPPKEKKNKNGTKHTSTRFTSETKRIKQITQAVSKNCRYQAKTLSISVHYW
jgi:hypothetical protein